ncbi:MAG: N-acetyl-D-Glu racemase DgcA [Pseudomonadota bacterium]
MKMTVETRSFPFNEPFAITGYVFEDSPVVWVILEKDGCVGRGEAVGVYYLDETVDGMAAQLQAVRQAVESGATRDDIQSLLPHGGARNALDCAFWDLEAKQAGVRVWELLDQPVAPVTTVYTIGIDSAEAMAKAAGAARKYANLKIKLDDDGPVEKMQAIRAARPDASLVIDVNQGWSIDALKTYAPALAELGVAMIEQPLPRGRDADLAGYASPIPLGADESCLHSGEFAALKDWYDVINIKLDKTGGFTEALKLAAEAKAAGKDLMVGNMMGTSLSMAPSFVIAQMCRFVDIDGPLLLAEDVDNALVYEDGGRVDAPSPALWG